MDHIQDNLDEEDIDFDEVIDAKDMNEDIIKKNFCDQDGRLVCLICYKIFNKNSFELFKSHFKTHPRKMWCRQMKNSVRHCEKCNFKG